VERVSARHRVMLITKGDLFNQESKLARSGMGERFAAVEIVSEKDSSVYDRILRRYDVDPTRFVMIGNSLRSDILPVLDIGGWAAHVPYHLIWRHELVDDDAAVRRHPRFRHLESLAGLPAVLADIESHDGG
jgi:putative hydrolase of the HAD superfamily